MIRSVLFCGALWALTAANASAALVLGYNFNNLTPAAAGVAPSNFGQFSYSPSSGAGSLTLSGWVIAPAGSTGTGPNYGVTNFGGSTVNALPGEVGGQALALQGGATGTAGQPNNGARLTLRFNMLNFIDPILTFATQRSNTGFNANQLAWSTDGVNFTDFGSAFNPATAFATQTFDLSAINQLDHATDAYLRITFTGATSAAGNNRIDNIQVNATLSAVPEPSSWMLVGLVAMGGLLVRRKAL